MAQYFAADHFLIGVCGGVRPVLFAFGAMEIVVVRIVRVVWFVENVEALVIASAHSFLLRVTELHAYDYQ